MSSEEVVRRMFEAFAAGDEEALRDVSDDEIEFVDPAASGSSVDEWLAYNRPFSTAFPDGTMTIENQVISGDTVVSEVRYAGTHSGPLTTPQGEVPPTDNRIDIRGCSVTRVEGGKIVSHHGYFDRRQFLAQLGLMEQPAAPR
jgi:predicted ester cyclase